VTDQPIVSILSAALFAFIGAFVAEPVLLALARIFGIYAIVQERTCRVYMLFGKVVGELDEPGLHFLPGKLGFSAFVINWLGSCYVLDLRLDQEYLRSQPVNSEEGAPMGVGVCTKCGSAIPSPTCSRTLTRAVPCAPTSAMPRCVASAI